MVGRLLTRGMLAGFIAGVICFGFLKIFGEPQVDRAIAFETQMDQTKEHAHADHVHADHAHTEMAKDQPHADHDPELVSRETQAGLGLFTGVAIYSTAFGGLFALAFALAYGRVAKLSPRATSALLATMGFVAVYAVPNLKYPANPPAVGDDATIGMRTATYFAMIALSLAAMIAAAMLRKRLLSRFDAWNAGLIAGGAYFLAVIILGLLLPSINEVPAQFPAVVLWQFRIVAFGAQVLMWAIIGLAFGFLAERLPLLRDART